MDLACFLNKAVMMQIRSLELDFLLNLELPKAVSATPTGAVEAPRGHLKRSIIPDGSQ